MINHENRIIKLDKSYLKVRALNELRNGRCPYDISMYDIRGEYKKTLGDFKYSVVITYNGKNKILRYN